MSVRKHGMVMARNERAIGSSLAAAARTSGRLVGILVAATAIGIFLLWDADWWALRDRFEHIKASMFGEYVTPACRRDPDECSANGKRRPRTKQEACAEVPGLKLHCTLYTIVDDMNRELFGGRLPPVVITLQRKAGAGGYYAHLRFKMLDGQRISEIAINPSYLRNRSMKALAAVAAHELVHLEQAYFGKPGRAGFHNIEWGMMMRRIGLEPSSTGKPGGDVTGTRMSHYIKPGGRFDRFANAHPMIGNHAVPMFE